MPRNITKLEAQGKSKVVTVRVTFPFCETFQIHSLGTQNRKLQFRIGCSTLRFSLCVDSSRLTSFPCAFSLRHWSHTPPQTDQAFSPYSRHPEALRFLESSELQVFNGRFDNHSLTGRKRRLSDCPGSNWCYPSRKQPPDCDSSVAGNLQTAGVRA